MAYTAANQPTTATTTRAMIIGPFTPASRIASPPPPAASAPGETFFPPMRISRQMSAADVRLLHQLGVDGVSLGEATGAKPEPEANILRLRCLTGMHKQT